MNKTRIFVACADERLRIALVLLLDQEPGIVIAGITDRLTGLITQLEATQPDIVLLEWKIPLQSIFDLLTGIHNLGNPPKVIYLSSKPEEEAKIIGAGADYFIAKNAPPDQLVLILNKYSDQSQPYPT